MSRLIIATLITLVTAQAFAADAPKSGGQKALSDSEAQQELAARKVKRATANKEFYDKEAAVKGTTKTKSGLLYRSLREGSGASPGIFSTVKVHYRGTLANNKEFNSSYKHKSAEKHHLNRVIPCWSEGLQKMKVGGKARLVCPPELAFGDKGIRSLVPSNAIVIYEIELLEVKN
jgi:FKBP-type peptidyl-prolyl cis-trans isomerase FkpA